MKKLLTMIGAAAAAFGLYADTTTLASTSFEGAEEFSDNALVIGDQTGWSCADGEAKLLKGTYDPVTNPKYVYDSTKGIDRYEAFGDDQAAYLSVKTAFGKPLTRTFTQTGVADGTPVYFDQLVKFTACDEAPTTEYADAKILVYVQDLNADQDGAEPDNRLMVKAGKYESGNLTEATYDLGAFADFDAWHRITIKAINAYDNQELGFVIYVDGKAKAAGVAGYDTAATQYLTPGAKALNDAKKIFPSLVSGDATVTSVAFDGQGEIDDLMVTDLEPGAWAIDKNVKIAWDEHLTALTYQIGAAAATEITDVSALEATIPFVDENTVITLNPTFDSANGWAFDKIEGKDITADGQTFRAANDQAVANIISKDTTERVTVTIGGEDMAFPQLAQAFAYINAQADAAKIVLREDATLKTTTIDNVAGVTEGTITGEAAVEIDLNGCTITGPASCTYGYTLDVATSGGLKITDSSELKNGKILASNAGAITCYGCKLTMDAGIVEGKVTLEDATSEISGGSFLAGEEEEFPLDCKTGYEAKKIGNYWVVSEKAKFTLTIAGGANATIKINNEVTTSAQLADGDSYTVTVTPNEYYEYAADGEYGAFIYSEGNLVATGTISDNTALTAADATPTEWTITYCYEDESEFATDTYNIKNRTTKALNAGDRVGYKFVKWEDYEGNAVTSLAELTGPITLYGVWEALPVVAKINDASYYSLKEAFEAVQSDETVVVQGDVTDETTFILGNNKANVTLDLGGYTVDHGSGTSSYVFQMMTNSTLTITNGVITRAAPSATFMKLFGNAELTVAAGATLQNTAAKDCAIVNFDENVTAKVILDGGTLKTDCTVDYAQAATPEVVRVCKGGSFEMKSGAIRVGGLYAYQAIDVFANGGTCVIKGGEVDGEIANTKGISGIIPADSTATFDRDQTALCAEGYETKLDEQTGRYAVVAKASPYIDPTDPTSKQTVEAANAEAAIAAAQVAVPAEAQAYVGAEAYKAYFNFTATQAGENKYDVQILGLKPEVVEAPTTADLVAKFDEIGEDGLTVVAKPGLFYGVKQAAAVDAVAEAKIESAGMATSQEITLPVAKQGDAGFYKIVVDVKAFPVE